MATVYLRSTDGNDADDGSTWALADATLVASLVAAGAGGRSYVSDAHAETQAGAMTLTSSGTSASPTEVLCGDDVAEPPTTLKTTATISSTGANINFGAGHAYVYGCSFIASSGSTNAEVTFGGSTSFSWILDNCLLKLNTTSTSPRFTLGPSSGGDDQLVRLINSRLSFGHVSQSIALRTIRFEMFGGSIIDIPPTVFVTPLGASSMGISALFQGVDLSLLQSGKSLVSVAEATPGLIQFINCKLGPSVGIVTGTRPGPGGINVRIINCDSGNTNYRYFWDCYQGQITHETTIVRSGGASDGTTSISRKMVSSANSKFYSPLESDPIVFWNETINQNITVTIPVITDNVTLTDAEAWIEVEYLGTSGFPLSVFTSDRASNILSTPANQTTDSGSTWTTTDLSTPTKQSLSVTFRPEEKGPVKIRVMLAKASTTMYFDPLAQVS